MYNQEQKNRFIIMRANGLSFEQIRLKTKISKPTLIKWDKDFKNEIINYQKEKTNEIMLLLLNESIDYIKELLEERKKAVKQFKGKDYKPMNKNELINFIAKIDSVLNKNINYLSSFDINLKYGFNSPYFFKSINELGNEKSRSELNDDNEIFDQMLKGIQGMSNE